MKVIKIGGAGRCFVYICNICGDQITSVRFGGYQSEEIGNDIHICSSCCARPEILKEHEREKALTFVKIYDALESKDDVESLSYWPRTPEGDVLSFKKVFSIANHA